MSAQQVVDLIHRLEEHSTLIVTESDDALIEALSYELELEDNDA